MNTKYTIKNFRVFDHTGATFEIAPITILTGCNSAGKSSLVKSMLLLDRYLDKVRKGMMNGDCKPETYPLEFVGSDIRLGRFTTTLNKKASKDEAMSFAITSRSNMANMDFVVEYNFSRSENDPLDNGWLSSLNIRVFDGDIVISLVNDGTSLKVTEANLTVLREPFFKFVYYAIGRKIMDDLEIDDCLGNLSKEERHSLEKDYEKWNIELKNRMNGVDYHTFKKVNVDTLHSFTKEYSQYLEKIVEQNTLFVMPSLDLLANVSREDFSSVITKNYSENTDFLSEKRNYYLQRIQEDFEHSSYDTFLEYFLDWEKKEGLTQFNKKGESSIVQEGLFSSIRHYILYGYDTMDEMDAVSVLDLDSTHRLTQEEIRDQKQQRLNLWRSHRDEEPISFQMIYDTIMNCSTLKLKECESELSFIEDFAVSFTNKSYDLFRQYVIDLLKEIILPSYTSTIDYVGSARASIKRLYSFDEKGDTFDKSLVDYLAACRNYKGCFVPGEFIDKWISKFNIGHSVTFDSTAEGLGILVHLHADAEDKEGTLLADQGYGITQLLSILICIERQIMAKTHSVRLDELKEKEEKLPATTISIEEPEIHLHPCFQSMLADMFVEAYKLYNIHFIIETHSEYLIRKLQTYIPLQKIDKEAGLARDEISMYYLYDSDPVKRPLREPQVKSINFREDGSLASPFGKGFFDEADNLAMSLLFGK